MLVLTRLPGQDILIGDELVYGSGEHVIRIQVVGISGNKVRIGIEAPEDLIIIRSELVGKKETVQ